jgi:biopolymer transport protein ExbB/TolQ
MMIRHFPRHHRAWLRRILVTPRHHRACLRRILVTPRHHRAWLRRILVTPRHHRAWLRRILVPPRHHRACPGGANDCLLLRFVAILLFVFFLPHVSAQEPSTAELISVTESEIKSFVIAAERQRQKLIDEQNTVIQSIAAAEEQKRRLLQTERQLAHEIAYLEHENNKLTKDLTSARDRIQSLRINLDMETPPALAAMFSADFEAFDTDTNTEFANLPNRFRKIANLANRLLLASMTIEPRPLEASLPNGRVVAGTAVLLGSTTFFSSETEEPQSGWLIARRNALTAVLICPVAQKEQDAIRSWIHDQAMIRLPIDPSDGKALEALANRSTTWEHLKAGGYIMIPLAVLGLGCIVIMVIKIVHFHNLTRANITGPIQNIVELLQKNDSESALTATGKLGNPLESVILQGINHLGVPKEQLEELMYERMLAQQPRLERLLAPLAVFASTAPLLGLLGTVTGMIRTFRLITLYGTGNAQLLSDGISEALITTETGLAIAIPALLMHAYLSRRLKAAIAHTHQAAIMFVNNLASSRQ